MCEGRERIKQGVGTLEIQYNPRVEETQEGSL